MREMGMDMRERMARAICEADGHDPDQLEPGDDPYHNNCPVIDGRNRKGEACHLFWRRWDRLYVDAVLAALREPSEAMIYAGEQAINANIMGEPGAEDESVSAWQAMIDVASSDSGSDRNGEDTVGG